MALPSPTITMQVELVVPGLLWPFDDLGQASRDLPLPALATLIGRGRLGWSPPASTEALLADRAGLDVARAPWAALRLAGEGLDAGDSAWLCADPVHLRFMRNFFILGELTSCPPSADEAQTLVAALNRELDVDGEFIAAAPTRWYLRLNRRPDLLTHPLRAVSGRRIDSFLPSGGDAQTFQRLGNESQILLHTHQISERREECGLPRINSLWLWGAGKAPSPPPACALWSDDVLARGLAAAAGGALPPDAASLLARTGQSATVIVDALEAPCMAGDVASWRQRLLELEQRWLAPLVQACYGGRLSALRLSAPGDEALLEMTLEPAHRWQFWRRARALSELRLPRTSP